MAIKIKPYMKWVAAIACGLAVLFCAVGNDTSKTAKPAAKEEEKKEQKKTWKAGETSIRTWNQEEGKTHVQIICPVTNEGKTNLYLSPGRADLLNADDSHIASKSMLNAYPAVIQPGETGWYCDIVEIDGTAPEGLKASFSESIKDAEIEYTRLGVSDINIASQDGGGVTISGQVENTTKEAQVPVIVAALFFGADGSLLGSAEGVITDEIAPAAKTGFTLNSEAGLSWLTAESVDHYEIYAYPLEYQI